MAYNNNNYPQNTFWDFVREYGQNGVGVDHPAGPPPQTQTPGAFPPPPPNFGWGGPGAFGASFGPRGGWGGWAGAGAPHGRGGGRRGRQGRDHDGPFEHEGSRSRTVSPSGPEGEGEESGPGAGGPENRRGPRGPGCHGRGGHRGGRGGWGAWGGHHGHRGPHPPFGQFGQNGFDLNSLFEALNNSPLAQQRWAQMARHYAEQAGLVPQGQQSGETAAAAAEDLDAESTFTPPIDVFSTETAFVLHIALPGAKKEDVGVNWDSDKGILNVAGVVYRQGDEDFLKTLSQSERKVGMFERNIKLPPGNEEKEEVNADAITAKLEDGVLVVTVPKIEKEWTEVKRVDIE